MGSIPVPLKISSLMQDSSWQDQDRLPLEGQVQDPAQEALVPVHVHVLPARVQAHGAPDPGREEAGKTNIT